jgi:Kef-type K+ transport system membrane component KefB
MEHVWFTAAFWLGLAVIAGLLAVWLKVSVALVEIIVGTVAQFVMGLAGKAEVFDVHAPWITFVAGAGAIMLTFLAGAELDPDAFRNGWKQATWIGLVGFAAPFLLAAAAAHWILGWDARAAWLGGVALSTTSVAVVYAVMLDYGLNRTPFGKAILAACFVNDLGTVIALGLLFAPFTMRTVGFLVGMVVVVPLLALWVGPFIRRFGGRPSELETKLLLFALFLLGGLAAWAGSEAVLAAYVVGMVLAGSVGRNHELVRRLRTLTIGLLTPFYFIRAGLLVLLPAVAAGFGAFATLFFAKVASKYAGLLPLTRKVGYEPGEAQYFTLLMSTGLTFGSISALYGLTHHIVTQGQYSLLVAAVIASAVLPTWVANRFFLPYHHLPKDEGAEEAAAFATEDE